MNTSLLFTTPPSFSRRGCQATPAGGNPSIPVKSTQATKRSTHNTAAITPTVDQLEVLTKKAKVLSMFQGIVDPDYPDTHGRLLIAKALGRTHHAAGPQACPRKKGVHTMDPLGVSS